MSPGGNIPKGMELTKAPEVKKPEPLNLELVNYVGAIRRALVGLPVEVQVMKCLVIEENGKFPEVQLIITVLGEKKEYHYKEGTE
jgi:hypothetical protein